MVLSQNRGLRFSLSGADADKAPNPLRIAATSTAIALHVVALLVLVAPVAVPPIVDEPPVVRVVPLAPKDETKPPDPPPPIPVEIVRPQPTDTPVQRPVQQAVAEDVPIVSDEGSVAYVPPVVDAGPVATPSIDPAPAAVRLEYANAPPPVYPVDAKRDGRQGVVMLQVTVGVDGKPIAVEVVQSSGHRDLDLAARMQVLKRWRFRAAMKDGVAVQAIGMVPINFTLSH
ncbi:TonB family protein [Luteimonas sp. SX5]|uniref:TonB family protein n=1 Tax=Luteimonas galliterrae TaxID=2940486 RepID=A0ABT0ME49_9GAMM|nr:energy transducer TonB [Luteimonas galliterrae]MCL1633135.1 TonB family protein [Luteimonas galliterrae]